MNELAKMFEPIPAGRINGHFDNHSAAAEYVWRPIVPVPSDAPRLIPRHRLGQPSAVWDYRDAAGLLISRVCRWDDGEGAKTILPLTYCENDVGGQSWQWQQLPSPRPLYGLDRLALHPDAPVIVVEGEKAADAASKLFPDHVAVTSLGGSNAASKADWSPLAGRSIVIWPDHDKAGCGYAADVARLAHEAGAVSVLLVEVPRAWPEGWDLADALPNGATPATLREMLKVAGDGLFLIEPAARDGEAQGPADEPVPLMRPMPPAKPFPIDGLGPQLAMVVRALNEIVQSPLAMCANSVLATVTLAAQAHVNVELPFGEGTERPVSCFFVTVGRSGERKSATDELVMKGIKSREAELRSIFDLEMRAYRDAHDAWEAARKTVLGGKGTVTSKKVDLDVLGDEPQPPRTPIITTEEPTIEGLAKLLMTGQPSAGVFSAEGGQFVGGHAMSDDAKLRSAAALSRLWDGEPWKRVRSIDGAHSIAGSRLSLHLMVQPAVATLLVNDAMLRDQGLVSRLLVTFPTTTMGTRMYRAASPEALSAVQTFNVRMAKALARSFPIRDGTRNELSPRRLIMSADARACWTAFCDHGERKIASGGKFEQISGFAAKMSEHAARLAGAITWWRDHEAVEIDKATLLGAIEIVAHYGDEALRLYQASAIPVDIAEAQRLLEWLTSPRWKGGSFVSLSVADICHDGPNSVRVAKRARELIKILEDHRLLTKVDGGALVNGRRRREAWLIWGKA